MLYEVDGFGIKATLVVGGHMQRDEIQDEAGKLNDDNQRRQNDKIEDGAQPDTHLKPFQHFHIKSASAPYASSTSPAGHSQRMLQWIGDNQPTSAIRSAELVWQLGHCSFPPLRLLLGSYAVESMRDRLRSILEEIEDWKHLGFAAVEVETEMAEDRNGEELQDGGAGDDGEIHDEPRDGGEEMMGGL